MLCIDHSIFRRKHSDTGEALSQRSQISESQLSKKPRLELDKCKKVKSMSKKSKSQSTEVQSSVSEDHTHSATAADHALLKAKGDVLDRFWASVEPYCADITDTELNMLQEGMKSVRTCRHISLSLLPSLTHSLYLLSLTFSLYLSPSPPLSLPFI